MNTILNFLPSPSTSFETEQGEDGDRVRIWKRAAANLAAKPALRALLSYIGGVPVPAHRILPRVSRLFESPGIEGSFPRPPEAPPWLDRFFLSDVFRQETDGRPSLISAEDLVIGDILVVKPQHLILHTLLPKERANVLAAQSTLAYLGRVSLLAIADPEDPVSEQFDYSKPFRRLKTRSTEWALGNFENLKTLFTMNKAMRQVSEKVSCRIKTNWQWPVPFFITREMLDERNQELRNNAIVQDYQVTAERAMLMPLVVEFTFYSRQRSTEHPQLVGTCLTHTFSLTELRPKMQDFCVPLHKAGVTTAFLKYRMHLSVYPGISDIVRELKQETNLAELDDAWLFDRLLPYTCTAAEAVARKNRKVFSQSTSFSISTPKFPPPIDVIYPPTSEITNKFDSLWEVHESSQQKTAATISPSNFGGLWRDLENLSERQLADTVDQHRQTLWKVSPLQDPGIDRLHQMLKGWSRLHQDDPCPLPAIEKTSSSKDSQPTSARVSAISPIALANKNVVKMTGDVKTTFSTLPRAPESITIPITELRPPSFGPYAPSGFLPESVVAVPDKVAAICQTDLSSVVSPPRPRLRLPPAFDHYYRVAKRPLRVPMFTAAGTQTQGAILPAGFIQLTNGMTPEDVDHRTNESNCTAFQVCPVEAFAGSMLQTAGRTVNSTPYLRQLDVI